MSALPLRPQPVDATLYLRRSSWSPEQISGWLTRVHPREESYQVSHETIYRSLFVQTRGVLKKELLQYLRSKRTMRRSKQATQKGGAHGQIKDMISISERPASVEDRAVPGHREGDLITGSKNSHIATLVERHTRYVMLVKVAHEETQTVVSALIEQAKKLPAELYKSLPSSSSSLLISITGAWHRRARPRRPPVQFIDNNAAQLPDYFQERKIYFI
jgi:IS30 family transposase